MGCYSRLGFRIIIKEVVMAKRDSFKMLVVTMSMGDAINQIQEYLEEPPEEISFAINHIKRVYNCLLAGGASGVGLTSDKAIIPEECMRDWNAIPVPSLKDINEMLKGLGNKKSDEDDSQDLDSI